MKTAVLEKRDEGYVKVITDDYAVLRYDDNTLMQHRRHDITMGRHTDADAAFAAREQLGMSTNKDIVRSSEFLHIEERSETWEEPVECDCGSTVVDEETNRVVHYEECALIQIEKESE